MHKLLAMLITVALAATATAAEGPRKVWTAADVIAASGGTPPEVTAAEAEAAAAATPARAAAKAKKTAHKAKKKSAVKPAKKAKAHRTKARR